jgi:hypothetical protein
LLRHPASSLIRKYINNPSRHHNIPVGSLGSATSRSVDDVVGFTLAHGPSAGQSVNRTDLLPYTALAGTVSVVLNSPSDGPRGGG